MRNTDTRAINEEEEDDGVDNDDDDDDDDDGGGGGSGGGGSGGRNSGCGVVATTCEKPGFCRLGVSLVVGGGE